MIIDKSYQCPYAPSSIRVYINNNYHRVFKTVTISMNWSSLNAIVPCVHMCGGCTIFERNDKYYLWYSDFVKIFGVVKVLASNTHKKILVYDS